MINNPEDLFIQNKYYKLYKSIIEKAKQRPYYKKSLRKINYVENHHIIPKSLGGLDFKENLIQLTAREHYIAHWLLPKFTIGKNKSKMLFAFEMMNKMGSHINSKTYERYKLIFSENQKNKIVSNEIKRKLSKANLGRIHSEETKEKIRKSNKGLKRTDNAKLKMKKPKSKEHKLKMSLSKKGKSGHSNSTETIDKIKLALTGGKLSEDHKLKVSQTLKSKGDLAKLNRLGVSKKEFHKIGMSCNSMKELLSKFPSVKSYNLVQTLKAWYGTTKFHEAFNKNKLNPNKINRFKRLGVKDFKEFDSIAKKCLTLEEFNNSFNCESSYIRKCLSYFYGNSSFYKIFNKQRSFSKETKEKMALAKIGTKRSKEVRKKLSENHKSKRYGIPQETCNKISLSLKGRVSSMKGRKHSKKTIEKMRKTYANKKLQIIVS